MSKEMWLARDEAWVVFDTKEVKDIIGLPKMDSEVLYFMSDKDAEEFNKVRDEWYKWQRRLASHLDGK